LPASWDVTSDSISAVLARRWELGELILVKSAACPIGRSAAEAAAEGLVDRYFPHALDAALRVRWCNGREAVWRTEAWLGGDEPCGDGILMR
jgi:aspartokinase-like uncharacterized kinase